MSEWRKRYEESPELGSAFALVESYYHYAVIAVLGVFMLWLRVRTWGRFLVDGEVLFNGNDPWYHYRQIVYTVEHWPQTMPFEVFTNFPKGTAPGQFGTFFDQIVATIALVVGLGNPSEQLIATVALFAPVLFALAVIVPTYVMGRRLGGRAGGVTAVIVIALTSGAFLSRSWVGTVDHHIAEMLFQVLGVLGMMIALSVASREKPIFEQVFERDFAALRPTIGWSALAGVAVAMYLWVWPFGVMLVGVLGIFFLVQLSAEFLRGESPEHTAIAGAIAMSVTGVLLLAKVQFLTFSPSDFTLLQAAMPFGLAAWVLGMAWLARVWESKELTAWQYPVAVVGALAAFVLATSVLAPGIFDLFVKNLSRIVPLGTSQEALTVGEISPLRNPAKLFQTFKFSIFAALLGGLVIAGRLALGRRVRSEYVLVVVWAALMTSATFAQERFAYYMVVPVAILTGYVVGRLVEQFSLGLDDDFLEFFRVAGIVTLAVLLVVPMVVVAPTPMAVSSQNTPGDGIQGWTQSLEWMEGNTPAEGQFGNGSTNMDYGGKHALTDDYDYPNGAYGVLSWWDYGHWITVQSQRIPVANPFQQHATEAANFLLAQNESQAAGVLSGLGEDDAETRYAMIDWKMVHTNTNLNPFTPRPEVNGKFFAPTEFYDAANVSTGDYFKSLYTTKLGQLNQFTYRTQNYYESMVVRLYKFHGSAVEPQPMVLDWQVKNHKGNRLAMTPGQSGRAIRFFPNMSAAEEYVANDPTSQIGGIGGAPSARVPALEHYRMVGSSEMKASASGGYRYSELITAAGTNLNASVIGAGQTCDTDVSLQVRGGRSLCLHQSAQEFLHPKSSEWTKAFERVPGATIEGTGPANANVTASVQMRNHVTNETFTYQQRARTNANGEFTMTVPYSTTGYDQWGPENGHTNVSVRATGPYQFRATGSANGNTTFWTGSTQVSEGKVIGETEGSVSVDMTQVEVETSSGGSSGNATGTTDGSGRIAPIAGASR